MYERDRQTDTAWRHRPCSCIASRGKNLVWLDINYFENKCSFDQNDRITLYRYVNLQVWTSMLLFTRPPVRHWRRQHNGRWLWTTGSKRRTTFTTVDNTGARLTTAVVWGQTDVEQEAVLIFAFETRISTKGIHEKDLNERENQHSIVTVGLSCLMFEIWPWDGQRTYDERRTDSLVGSPAKQSKFS